ncbi:MAG: Gfo/Idh/MocA family oxidoreductase, partial [Gemmatimonadota bacterium]|nr:Gfo/Idh/MocA family oxidoreductase [Gemmatimonadota bacterium]
MSPTKVAVIGCGHIATSQHLPAYREAADAGVCTLVGVCDLVPERLARASRQFEAAGFRDAEAMLEKAKPDVVSIATLPSNHRDLAVMCLEAGCHVLCEKPVAMNAGEARDMVHAAKTNNRLLSICLEYRTWDEARYLRDRIADGVLGHVHAVRTWGGNAYGLPKRAHQSHGLNGGGVLAHWTIHNLDLAL